MEKQRVCVVKRNFNSKFVISEAYQCGVHIIKSGLFQCSGHLKHWYSTESSGEHGSNPLSVTEQYQSHECCHKTVQRF